MVAEPVTWLVGDTLLHEPTTKEQVTYPNGFLDRLRPPCRDGDAGVLCTGEAQPVVHFGVCRLLRASLGLRLPPGGLAVRFSRSSLVCRRDKALVVRAPGRLRIGELTIDFAARTVTQGTTSAHPTPKELDLLRQLTQHANEAVSRRGLLQTVWGPDYGEQVDYLRAFIKSLRRKSS
jgi:hypothetical protein